jgi:protein-tyrosine phosphatase
MDRRTFLLAAVANGTLAAAAPTAFAASKSSALKLQGQATRVSPEGVRLDWSAKTRPVSIYMSSDPAAPRRAMRKVKTGAVDGSEISAAVSPRPYFLLEAANGDRTRVAERLLPLAGGRNFRDLGGYDTADGRQVRWGRIYRSGVMSGLTDADRAYLSSLGVKVICDLRNPQEREAEPSPFLKAGGPRVVSYEYDMNTSLAGLQGLTTRDQAIAAFAAAYVGFLDLLTPHYTDLFARLVEGDAPLAMNCSAGKDRTGMGAALVLSVLGVPRDTVLADYALTQTYTPPSFYRKQMAQGGATSGITAQQAQAFAKMPPEVLNIIMGSDPAVMSQALSQIDRKYGGPIALAKSRFGLSDGKIATLRGLYLI